MSLKKWDALKPLGWSDFFENQTLDLKAADWLPARVVGEEKGFLRLQTTGTPFWGELSGHYRHTAIDRLALPATGDWVACTLLSGGRAQVHAIYQRRSCLVRKVAGRSHDDQVLAANVDTVFITASITDDIKPRWLERYLAVVWESGAVPVVLLTKVDLLPNAAEVVAAVQAIAIGVEVIPISSLVGTGMDSIAKFLSGHQTVVLLGASGVGKSTLVNHVLGREALKTQAVREEDGKGRHTTTARYLFQIPGGGLLIDTPGMRELGLTDHEEGVQTLFDDILELAQQCRFGNCQHKTEPGCAVKQAIESGALAPDRMQSYENLQREIGFEARKTDKGVAAQSKKHWKQISKAIKKLKK
jgi:ribosome biogenesis GTPase / thiamine phosphate phosphatase